ncbi:hypothetical protein BH11BAC4_BH11BAC4_10230 [soil metagenome]
MKQNGILHNDAANDTRISSGDKTLNMESQVKDNIESLFEKTGDYLETRIDLYKLKAVDTSSDIISSFISKLVVLFVFAISIIIINIGIALLLGELLGKSYYGFFIVAGFYLIAGLIFNSMRSKWFKAPIADSLIKKFLK